MTVPPPLLHGNHWTGQNVCGWWCSEKFDGWRAYWDGHRLLSRQGNDYHAPAWFTESLPRFPLDCELWLGVGKTDADVHKAVARGQWGELWIVAFDVPGTMAETGIEILRSLTPVSNGDNLATLPAGRLIVASFWRVESADDAKSYMQDIVHKGGEGVMLRRPGSLYRNTRCDDLLKIKP
ncbi:MAG TPA: hypothetical protein P5205_22155 [Candidatus Paceibacterota bacterium]|nr:hypothetical protein [Candidatus Paceibacterota bacterium]